jgi:hypothetical protein
MEGSFWLCIYQLCASSRYHPFGRWFVPQMHCETMEILCLQTMIFFSFSLPDSLFLPSPVIKLLNSSRNFSMSRKRFFICYLKNNNNSVSVSVPFFPLPGTCIGHWIVSCISHSLCHLSLICFPSVCVYTSNFPVPITLKLVRFRFLLCGALFSVICTQVIGPNWIGM